MSPLNRLPALALAGLLAGCTMGPDFATPTAPDVGGYQMAGDRAPSSIRLTQGATAGPWWTALSSPALDSTMQLALAGNPTLDEADATLLQAQALLAAAQGTALPQLGINAGAARNRTNLQATGFGGLPGFQLENPTFPLYSLGAAVSYDLDLFGKTKRGIEAASARAEAEGWRAEAAYLSITANVAMQAIAIAALRAEIAATEANIADDQQTVDLVTRANELGGSTQAAKLSATTQLERDRALLPPLKGQLAQARHQMALLVGQAPGNWAPPDFTMDAFKVAAVPLAVPSELVRRRPDIRAAEAELHAATAEIGVATANLYPDLSISASLTQGAQSLSNLFSYDTSGWSLAAGLVAPVLDGGTRDAQRQAAVAAAQAADARYRQTVLKAFVEVADALQAIATAEETIEAYRRTEQSASESLRLSRIALREGGGTLLDVIQAQRDNNQASAARIRAEGERLTQIIRLFAATGADWRSVSPAKPGA